MGGKKTEGLFWGALRGSTVPFLPPLSSLPPSHLPAPPLPKPTFPNGVCVCWGGGRPSRPASSPGGGAGWLGQASFGAPLPFPREAPGRRSPSRLRPGAALQQGGTGHLPGGGAGEGAGGRAGGRLPPASAGPVPRATPPPLSLSLPWLAVLGTEAGARGARAAPPPASLPLPRGPPVSLGRLGSARRVGGAGVGGSSRQAFQPPSPASPCSSGSGHGGLESRSWSGRTPGRVGNPAALLPPGLSLASPLGPPLRCLSVLPRAAQPHAQLMPSPQPGRQGALGGARQRCPPARRPFAPGALAGGVSREARESSDQRRGIPAEERARGSWRPSADCHGCGGPKRSAWEGRRSLSPELARSWKEEQAAQRGVSPGGLRPLSFASSKRGKPRPAPFAHLAPLHTACARRGPLDAA